MTGGVRVVVVLLPRGGEEEEVRGCGRGGGGSTKGEGKGSLSSSSLLSSSSSSSGAAAADDDVNGLDPTLYSFVVPRGAASSPADAASRTVEIVDALVNMNSRGPFPAALY